MTTVTPPSIKNAPDIKNLGALDFSVLLPGVMTIADEVDSQLTQAMESFTNSVGTPAAA